MWKKKKRTKEFQQNTQREKVHENPIKPHCSERDNYNMDKGVITNQATDLNQKISEILQKDPEIDPIPPKIRIISERIIMPTFKNYNEIMNNGTKHKNSDWLQKWKKKLSLKKSMKNTSKLEDSFISQQSFQSISHEPTQIREDFSTSQQCIENDIIKQSQEKVKPLQSVRANTDTDVPSIYMHPINKSQLSNTYDVNQQHSETHVKASAPTIKSTGIKENKSVHFNLQSEKEAEFNFQPILNNTVSSFFPKIAEGSDNTMAFETSSNANALNISLIDTNAIQDDFNNLQNTIQLSPEYQYDARTEQKRNLFNFESNPMQSVFETIQPPETSGRIFSFGSSYNPFQ